MVRLTRKALFPLLFLLLLFTAGALWWWHGREWGGTQGVFVLPESLASVTRIALRRGADGLEFCQQAQGWQTPSGESVVERTLQTLWDYFKRIDVRFPIAGELDETQRRYLRDSGLTVSVATPQQELIFTLGRQVDGELLLEYVGRYYVVRTAGFAKSTIDNLSLEKRQWVAATSVLAIQRPSDLAFVALEWTATPDESFRVEVCDSLRVELWPLSEKGSEPPHALPYDTVRMSAFLYALTGLTSDGTGTPETRARVETQVPLLRLRLRLRRSADTLVYDLYPQGGASTAYLRDGAGQLWTTPLVAWDAVMTTLPQLAAALPR